MVRLSPRNALVAVTLAGVLSFVGGSSAAPAPGPTAIAPRPTTLPRIVVADSGTAPAPAPTSAVVALSPYKSAILQQMNSLRASLGAPSMLPLTWDDNLATFATPVASTCEITHSTSTQRTNVPGWVGTYVGENVMSSTAGITSLVDATNAVKIQTSLSVGVTTWWNEKANYDYATNTCQTGKVCGHYTQVAWATTKSVGCALVICAPHKAFNAPGYSLVCEFGPGGNKLGQKPY